MLRRHAGDRAAVSRDAGHRAALEDPRAQRFGAAGKSGRHQRRSRPAIVGAIGRAKEVSGAETRHDRRDLSRIEPAHRRTETLLHRQIGAELGNLLLGGQQEEIPLLAQLDRRAEPRGRIEEIG